MRYHRSVMTRLAEEPGFEIDDDIEYALKIRMAHVLGGGYGGDNHKIPADTRAAVIERDRGVCVKCGAPGQEIDHIASAAPELDNLQLLCTPCHRSKTDRNLIPVSPDDPEHAHLRQMVQEIEARVHSPAPLKTCDTRQWKDIWRTELSKRVSAVTSP